MALVVYNTLQKRKEEFLPLHPPKVNMYVCGITAYDTCHLGHARAAIVFDVIFRHLTFRGYDVTYVRNYTDIDDKVINRANKEGVSCEEIATRYIQEYEQDMDDLHVLRPSITPKATEHIQSMLETIQKLVDRGLAYAVGGNVFFSVRSFPDYGKLSGKRIEELESGARVEVDVTKRDPLDFSLWKAAKPGEPTWDSPWGPGRPGWHIECSAMSSQYLGQPFDIHGGGRDLIFPHHENEIAQAEGALCQPFVRYWLHNGFINIESEKMSKSLGNITSIRDVLTRYDAEAIRLFLLSSHYRSPLDFTKNAMAEASASADRFYETALRLQAIHPGKASSETPDDISAAQELCEILSSFETRFGEAMDDDFNTARAIALVFETSRLINRYLDALGEQRTAFTGWVVLQFSRIQHILGDVLGIFNANPKVYLEKRHQRLAEQKAVDPDAIEQLLADRKAARTAKDYARADAIRDELAAMGVEIKDKPDGTTAWKLK